MFVLANVEMAFDTTAVRYKGAWIRDFTLKNKTKKDPVSFSLRTSHPSKLVALPSVGVIPPDSEVEVILVLLPHDIHGDLGNKPLELMMSFEQKGSKTTGSVNPFPPEILAESSKELLERSFVAPVAEEEKRSKWSRKQIFLHVASTALLGALAWHWWNHRE